jgi:hyperosmotically inducible periplasmic protein
MRRFAERVTVLFLVLLVATACRSMTGKSAGENIDDATITTQVKAKLTEERASNLTRVRVSTTRGTVVLSGVVETPAQRIRAEQLASQVKGVKEVTNNLQVEKP